MQLLPAERRSSQDLTVLVTDVLGSSASVYAAICHVAGWDVLLCDLDELPQVRRGPHGPDVMLLGLVDSIPPAPQVRHGGNLPVVLISSMDIDEQTARALGYAAVLVRPVIPSVLRVTVTATTQRYPLPHACARPAPLDSDPEYRDVMRQLMHEEFAELREASRTLRRQAQELCRYAAAVRRRASSLAPPRVRRSQRRSQG